MPVEWSDPFVAAELAALDVIVVDGQGREVQGRVELVPVPPRDSQWLVWRPVEALAPATRYTMRVRVASPEGAAYAGCTFPAIDLAFDVVTHDGSPEVVAAIVVDAVGTYDRYSFTLELGPEVCGREGAVACPDRPDVCCTRSNVRFERALAGRVSVTYGAGGGAYHVLTIDMPFGLDSTYGEIDGSVDFVEASFPEPDAPPTVECARVTLYSVLEGRDVAAIDACSVIAEHVATEPPTGCPAEECVVYGSPSEPAVEPVEAVETTRAEPLHEPGSDGCGVGPASLPMLALLVLMRLLAGGSTTRASLARRRSRSGACIADAVAHGSPVASSSAMRRVTLSRLTWRAVTRHTRAP